MVFAIGDIHGEIIKLTKLINNILKIDLSPKFIFIGDYINKGNNSKKVLDYLITLSKKYECIFLWGNHEYMWFNFLNDEMVHDYLKKYGGNTTQQSFNTNNFPQTYKILMENYYDFFDSLQKYCIYENYLITHSGISKENLLIDLNDIPLKEFLFNRYDFLSSKYSYKNYTFIFGHTGFYYPYVDKHKIGIDTGACYLKNQPLTSFCIEKKFFINSSNESFSLKYYQSINKPSIIKT